MSSKIDNEIPEEPADFFIYIACLLILVAIILVIWFFYTMKGMTSLL